LTSTPHPSDLTRGHPNVENKHLEWINSGNDLESDKDALEGFSTWVERPYTKASVELTIREGWESVDWDTVLH
jgi:hypothetical protein